MIDTDLTTTELKEYLIEADLGYSWSELDNWSWSELFEEYKRIRGIR